MEEAPKKDQWVVLEAMGHRRVAGRMSEVTIAGAQLVQIEVFCASGHPVAVQRYAGGALYCITDTTEQAAKVASNHLCEHPDHAKLLPAPSGDEDGDSGSGDDVPFGSDGDGGEVDANLGQADPE